ncbi:MAG: mycofactocin biosynthesis glycosyltransferase MftF [Ilumatobacteraceae bacterium]
MRDDVEADAPTRSFTFDRSVRRIDGGRVLIGGSPLKLFRLTEAGARLVDSLQHGGGSPPAGVTTPSPTSRLLDRLLDAGVIHPAPRRTDPRRCVTVVIPACDPATDTLAELVAHCARASGVVTVIVVDDASGHPIPAIPGATVVRRAENGGPGAARTTGLTLVTTALVAFVDTDVELDDGWLGPLIAHFDDDRVALVSPRVASGSGAGTARTATIIERYEALRSPLDLGDQPARVRAGSRVSYVPAALMVARVAALQSVGGFDDSLRVGEDVDLVWRLDEAGHWVRYEPAVTVHHRPRSSLGALVRQRIDYGASAAPLAIRHPGALAPVRVNIWSAATWMSAAAGFPLFGGLVATATTALLARRMREIPGGRRAAIRLAGLGHLFAGRSLAGAMTRAWWPFAAVASLLSMRIRRIIVVAAVVPPAIDWVRTQPPIDPVTYVGMRLLDDVAYGAGVVAGMIIERTLDPVRADLTSWRHTQDVRPSKPRKSHRGGPLPARRGTTVRTLWVCVSACANRLGGGG